MQLISDYFRGKVSTSKKREFGKVILNQKRESLEKEIDKEIESAEKEISDLKNNSREKINKIAIETSSDIVKQLINADVNSSSISAIVEDLSKKNKDKYNEI